MKFVLFVSCLVIAFLCRDIQCLSMTDIEVPEMVLIDDDDTDPVNLNCEYDLKGDNTFLVVKWLKDNEAVYQWIRGQAPSVFPQFKEQVDQSFTATSDDPDHEHSGMTLVNPTIHTSGMYKCVVQTAEATYSMEKRLQVVDISNYTLELLHNKIQNETHLECKIDNIYPEPKIYLTAHDGDDVAIVSLKLNEDENGFFNASANAVVSGDDDDGDDDVDVYMCTVSFLGLPLNLTATVNSAGGATVLLKMLLLLVAAQLIIH